MPYPEKIRAAVERLGAERVLYASDGPGLLAAARGREGAARRSRPGGGAPRPRRERGADPGGRVVTVDSLTFVGESLFGHARDRRRASPGARRDRDRAGRRLPAQTARATGSRRRTTRSPRPSARHPDRLVGFARVDPNLGDAAVRGAGARDRRAGPARPLPAPVGGDVPRHTTPRSTPLLDGFTLPVIVAAGLSVAVRGAPGRRAGAPPPGRDASWPRTAARSTSPGLGQTDAELALAANPNLVVQTTGVYREDFLEGVAARFGAGAPPLRERVPVLRSASRGAARPLGAEPGRARPEPGAGRNAERLLLG